MLRSQEYLRPPVRCGMLSKSLFKRRCETLEGIGRHASHAVKTMLIMLQIMHALRSHAIRLTRPFASQLKFAPRSESQAINCSNCDRELRALKTKPIASLPNSVDNSCWQFRPPVCGAHVRSQPSDPSWTAASVFSGCSMTSRKGVLS